MKNLLIAATALTLFTAPANAQLLGGSGGLGGALGGSIGGAGSIGAPLRGTLDNVRSTTRSTTRGAADVAGSTEGSQNANVRSGNVEANRSANAGGTASVAQLVSNSIAPIGGNASGYGSAQGNGSANAQLLGTDAVTGAARNGLSQVRDTAANARGLANPAIGQARTAAGNAAGTVTSAAGNLPVGNVTGDASGEGSGSADLTSSPLAVAGSAAATGEGAFAVEPGMMIMSPEGVPLGKVREVLANGQGQILQVVMTAKGARRVIPAGNLAASGNGLIFAQGEGSVEQGGGDEMPTE